MADVNLEMLMIAVQRALEDLRVLKDHAVKEGQAYDVHLFEMSAADWAEKRLKFREYADWDGQAWPPG